MIKRIAAVGATATVLCLGLTACSGSSSPNAGGSSPAPNGSAGAGTSAGAASAVNVHGVSVTADPAAAKLLPGGTTTLNIVTSAPYPPFEEFNSSHQLVGLDIDTGNALAAELGIQAKFSSIDFSGVIPAIQAGKYDVLLADTGDNADRSKALDFVEYSLQGEVLVVPSDNPHNITGLESMCGLTLAVESGDAPSGFFDPVQSYCSSHNKPPMQVKSLPKTSDALLAVTSGEADAQFVGVGAAPALVKQVNGKVKMLDVPGKIGGYAALYVGAGLPKNSALLPAIKAAMSDLLANGTLKQLFAKYGLQSTLIPSVKVDAISSGGQGLTL